MPQKKAFRAHRFNVDHPKSMYPGTNEAVEFSLKHAFPKHFKRHICVQHRQINNEMNIL